MNVCFSDGSLAKFRMWTNRAKGHRMDCGKTLIKESTGGDRKIFEL